MSAVLERFLRYVAYDTQAREDSDTYPSTPGQLVLLRDLVAELRAMGIADAEIDAHGYVMASIPATTTKSDVPVIGFIAHVDTSPEMSGANVRPLVHRGYDGRDLVLPDDPEAVLRAGRFALSRPVPGPRHRDGVGHDAARRRQQERRGGDHDRGRASDGASGDPARDDPHRVHARRGDRATGPRYFDVARFGARYAYTMDGGPRGELEFESFSADALTARLPRLQHSPRLRQGPHGERDQGGRTIRRPAAAPIACRRRPPTAARASCTPTSCRPPSIGPR